MDDSLLHKSGSRIPRVAWRRDPLGPPFQTSFVCARRFLQFSAAVPLADRAYRMVPIAFRPAPTPAKPPRGAAPEVIRQQRQAARLTRLPVVAAEQIAALRQALDAEPGGLQRPVLVVDGGCYTNPPICSPPQVERRRAAPLFDGTHHQPLRAELWGRNLGLKFLPDLPSAVLYAMN